MTHLFYIQDEARAFARALLLRWTTVKKINTDIKNIKIYIDIIDA